MGPASPCRCVVCVMDIPAATRDLRRRDHVERLHRLGPRVLDELLLEIGAARSCLTAIETTLERYAGLSQDVIAAADGDRFPARPFHEVRS